MFNWNVDETRFKREDPQGYQLWRLTQLINYGCDEDEKLDRRKIKKAWPKIKENVDPYKRRLIEYIIWDKVYSLPSKINFWDLPKLMKK